MWLTLLLLNMMASASHSSIPQVRSNGCFRRTTSTDHRCKHMPIQERAPADSIRPSREITQDSADDPAVKRLMTIKSDGPKARSQARCLHNSDEAEHR